MNVEERIIEQSDISEPTKKLSEMDADIQKQTRDDWNESFNDRMFDEGVYKVVEAGKLPRRYHEKKDAVKAFEEAANRSILYSGDRVLRLKPAKETI